VKSSISWDVPACSPLKVNRRFGGNVASTLWAILVTCFSLGDVSLAYTSSLKMEVKRSSEISIDFQRTTRHCTLEDRTLHPPMGSLYHLHIINIVSIKIIMNFNLDYLTISSVFVHLTHSLSHRAEPFLRSCQLCSHSRTSQHFMKP
jgi:hypothetical protein